MRGWSRELTQEEYFNAALCRDGGGSGNALVGCVLRHIGRLRFWVDCTRNAGVSPEGVRVELVLPECHYFVGLLILRSVMIYNYQTAQP